MKCCFCLPGDILIMRLYRKRKNSSPWLAAPEFNVLPARMRNKSEIFLCGAAIPQSERFTVRAAPNWLGPAGGSLWALSTPSHMRFSQRGCNILTVLSASCAPYNSGDLPPDGVRNSNAVMSRLSGMTSLPSPGCRSRIRFQTTGCRDFCGLV